MPDEQFDELELELQHDDKFGELLEVTIIDHNPNKPVIVAKIRRRDVDYLVIHRGYIKGNQLLYGKGISLAMEEEEADLVIMAAQGMILQNDCLMEE